MLVSEVRGEEDGRAVHCLQRVLELALLLCRQRGARNGYYELSE